MAADESEKEVGRLRRQLGISQSELARRAGISRQALNAIESGAYQPGVETALKISRELGTTVERLFGPPEAETISANWADDHAPQPGTRVALGRVGGRLMAFAQPAVDLKLAPAAGLLGRAARGQVTVTALRSREELDTALLIAGCDPAVAILGDWLGRHHSAAKLVALPRSSRAALAALSKAHVHVAGIHLRDPRSGEYNLASSRRFIGGRKAVLINFARWELGIAAAAGNPLGIGGWDDLARPGLKIVNREPGAGARMALDEALIKLGIGAERIAGYGRELRGHLEIAGAIAAGQADFGVTIRVAAEAYGAGFIPLREERYDLVIPKTEMDDAGVKSMLDTLNSRRFARELSALCGYDTSDTGRVMAELG
ncbi:MAG: substrate-binding domain-containing protein [Candidatus Binataceae bacterium]